MIKNRFWASCELFNSESSKGGKQASLWSTSYLQIAWIFWIEIQWPIHDRAIFCPPFLREKRTIKCRHVFSLLPPLLNTTFIPQFFHEIGVGQYIRLFKPLCQQRNSRDFSKFTHHCSFDGHQVLNIWSKNFAKKRLRTKLFMVYIRITICYNNYSGLVKPKINGFKSFCSSLVL